MNDNDNESSGAATQVPIGLTDEQIEALLPEPDLENHPVEGSSNDDFWDRTSIRKVVRAALAVAQPAQERLSDERIDQLQEEYDCFGECDAPRIHDFARAIEDEIFAAAQPAPVQPKQEPVAMAISDRHGGYDLCSWQVEYFAAQEKANGTVLLYSAAPQAVQASEPATERNQCDGCVSGAALDNGLHRDKDGRSTMACQAHRYEGAAPQPAAAVLMEERINALRSVLRVIVEQDPVELALDPQWCQRIAKGGLDATRDPIAAARAAVSGDDAADKSDSSHSVG